MHGALRHRKSIKIRRSFVLANLRDLAEPLRQTSGLHKAQETRNVQLKVTAEICCELQTD